MKILPHRDSISPILVSKGIVTEALEYSTISDKQNKNFDKDDILDILLSDNALVKETINLRQEMIRIDHFFVFSEKSPRNFKILFYI